MRRVAALLLPAVVVLAGCGTQASSTVVHNVADTPASHRVRVGLTEWQIDVAPTKALAGRVTLVVTNAGATEHDLVVLAGSRGWTLPALDPGQRSRLVVHARPGTPLRLSSTMPGQLHHMQATLPVGR